MVTAPPGPVLAGQDRLPATYALESLLQQVVFLSGRWWWRP